MSTVLSLSIDASAARAGAKEFADAVDRMTASGASAKKSIDDFSRTMESVAASTGSAARPQSILGRELAELKRKADDAAAGMGHLARETDEAGKSASGAIGGVEKLTSSFPLLGSAIKSAGAALAAGFSVQAIVGHAQAVTEHFGQIADAATRVGASAQEIQVLRQVFIANASSAAELGTAMEFLNVKTGDALAGNDQAIAAFGRLGISTEQLSATQGNAARQLELVAGSLTSIIDPSERAAAMQDLLGRSGKSTQEAMLDLGNTLNDKLNEALREGTILTDQQVQKFADLDDRMALLNERSNTLASDGLYAIQNAWVGIQEATLGAIGFMEKYLASQQLARGLEGLFKPDEPKLSMSQESALGLVTARGGDLGLLGQNLPEHIAKRQADEEARDRNIGSGKPVARYSGMMETEDARASKRRGGGRKGKSAETLAREAQSLTESIEQKSLQAHDNQIGLIELARDKQLAAIDKVSLSAAAKEALRVQVADTATQQIISLRQKEVEADVANEKKITAAIGNIEEAWLQSRGGREEIIIRQRDEELAALAALGASEQDTARARVQIEETASQEILQIRRQEQAEIESLERENIQQRASTSFGSERKRYQIQLAEMDRDSRLAEIAASSRSEEQKQRMSALISDTAQQRITDIDPTPLAAASKALLQFGENMTSVEGISQGVISGIASIGATASSAFADAIVSGENFGDTLEKLGVTLEKMLIQMTLQLAMQAALGAAATGIGGLLAPSPGAGAGAGASPYPMFSPLAKGGTVRSELPAGIYRRPTYFPMRDAGYNKFAKGVGLLGESGPEAVLPLSRGPSGRLGVETTGTSARSEPIIFNVQINNMSGAKVQSEERDNDSGGKDLVLTIADEVEGIVAARMGRSGTRVNRAVSGVGQLKAR